MTTSGRDINHDYFLYHLSSSKPVNEKDADKRFSFLEVLVDQYTEFVQGHLEVNKTKFHPSIARNALMTFKKWKLRSKISFENCYYQSKCTE